MENKTLKEQMLEKEYVVSPNNIHSLQGCIMYPAHANIRQPSLNYEVQVLSDRIRIFKSEFFGNQYSKKSFWDTITIAVFDSVEEFFTWCDTHGTLSLPGVNYNTD